MNNLGVFHAPNDGEVALCEIEGRIHTANFQFANVAAFTPVIDNYPQIHITQDLLQPQASGEDVHSLFVPVDEPFLKRLVQIYYEQGFVEALHLASNNGPYLLKKTAFVFLSVIRGFEATKRIFNSQTDANSLVLISDISRTRSWLQSPIRCVAWHWYTNKIAVAASDDSVRIFSSGSHHVPLLKCKFQKNITCLAWRPLSYSDLAVGCENGIVVWNIDPNSLVTRPSINNAHVLHRIAHKPVVSLAWCTRGDLLASVAACDSVIYVWNVEMDMTSSLKRGGCSGNVLLKWSPVGNQLFSATTGLIFRVWECQTWQAERWSLVSGRIRAACWSPSGTHMLFATSEEPILYSLSFSPTDILFAGNSKDSPCQAVPVFDLTKVDVDGLIIGGIVQDMDWDPKGAYLAVMFQDTDCVALFKITTTPVLQLSPSCLITGMPEERPTVIEFQKKVDFGACLTIGWSSGRLQHFPIIYAIDSSPRSQSYIDSLYRSFNNTYQSPNVSYH